MYHKSNIIIVKVFDTGDLYVIYSEVTRISSENRRFNLLILNLNVYFLFINNWSGDTRIIIFAKWIFISSLLW